MNITQLSAAELVLMRIFWERKQLAAAEVQQAATAKGLGAADTKQTLERLVQSRFLEVRGANGGSVYTVAIDYDQYQRATSLLHYKQLANDPAARKTGVVVEKPDFTEPEKIAERIKGIANRPR